MPRQGGRALPLFAAAAARGADTATCSSRDLLPAGHADVPCLRVGRCDAPGPRAVAKDFRSALGDRPEYWPTVVTLCYTDDDLVIDFSCADNDTHSSFPRGCY